MPRARVSFVCQSCGHASARWMGRCPGCGEWNSLVAAGPPAADEPVDALPVPDMPSADGQRLRCGIAEFDRVVGGGLVPGALCLLGGDPGVGKSTLLLQVAGGVARGEGPALYVTGEESGPQLRARAERLGALSAQLLAAPLTDVGRVEDICRRHRPRLVIVDSIQTMRHPDLPLAAGSPVQVREVAGRLQALAKGERLPVVMVGHVTKAGMLAGPRLLEHTVDVALWFEGERFSQYRVLRALKNRFGSTQELGVFVMAEDGLREVANPSAVFLAERAGPVPGAVVTVAMEGSRPLLCEVQALLAPPTYGAPRRTSSGVEVARLHLLMAVLDRRCAVRCSQLDAYLRVAGGLRVEEPATDLACALALASAFVDRAVPPDTVAVGEVGLGGELRGVARLGERLTEAARLGFRRAVVPAVAPLDGPPGLAVAPARTLAEALTEVLGGTDAGTDAGRPPDASEARG